MIERAAAQRWSLEGWKRHAKIERLMPALLEGMREDLRNNPISCEFVVLKRGWVYNSKGPCLAYYLGEPEDLEGNNVRRFLFQGDFVDYLTGA